MLGNDGEDRGGSAATGVFGLDRDHKGRYCMDIEGPQMRQIAALQTAWARAREQLLPDITYQEYQAVPSNTRIVNGCLSESQCAGCYETSNICNPSLNTPIGPYIAEHYSLNTQF